MAPQGLNSVPVTQLQATSFTRLRSQLHTQKATLGPIVPWIRALGVGAAGRL